MEIQDRELVERVQPCLDEVLDQAISSDPTRSGLAFGLLAQGRLGPGHWLEVFSGYRSRQVAPCVARSSARTEAERAEARRRCGYSLDGQRPDLVIVHSCRELAQAVEVTGPGLGQQVAQRVVEHGLSGQAMGACMGVLVDRIWESDGALLRVLEELGGKTHGAALRAHFMSLGFGLLDRLSQVARVEDRAFASHGGRGDVRCHATELYWGLVEAGHVAFSGSIDDVEIPPEASCLQELGLLLPHAQVP